MDSSVDPKHNLIFPRLYKNKKDCASFLTETLKEISDSVPGLHSDPKSHGLRIGFFNKITNHPSAGLPYGLTRGGWKLDALCTGFEYLIPDTSSLSIGGKAISDFFDCRKEVFPPSCESFMKMETPHVKTIVFNFMSVLYNYPYRLHNIISCIIFQSIYGNY